MYGLFGENNPNFGQKRTEESKKLMSDKKQGCLNNRYGTHWSEEQKAKMSRPQKVVSCPYCGNSGGMSMMKRWHFNNCKHKLTEL